MKNLSRVYIYIREKSEVGMGSAYAADIFGQCTGC
jgi:hypothetical protein